MGKTTGGELFTVLGTWLGAAIGSTGWILRAAYEVWPDRPRVAFGLLCIAILVLDVLPVMAVLIRFGHLKPGTAFKLAFLVEWVGCIIASLVLLFSEALALTSFSASDLWRINSILGFLLLLLLMGSRAKRSVVLNEQGYRWLMLNTKH